MTGRSAPLIRWMDGRLWESCSHGCTLQCQVSVAEGNSYSIEAKFPTQSQRVEITHLLQKP